jgi:hypothetical protein
MNPCMSRPPNQPALRSFLPFPAMIASSVRAPPAGGGPLLARASRQVKDAGGGEGAGAAYAPR